MGNKPEKLMNNNNQLDTNVKLEKLDELITNYLISENDKNPKINKLILEYFSKNNTDKIKNNHENSNLSKILNSNKFIDFSFLIANQIQIKALEKDLNLNFPKSFLLNSHAIQLCSVEDLNNNILFDNKTALLQMNSYDKKFNEDYSDIFIKREIKKYDSIKKKIKDELQFEKAMDEEIKNLRKSKNLFSEIIFN